MFGAITTGAEPIGYQAGKGSVFKFIPGVEARLSMTADQERIARIEQRLDDGDEWHYEYGKKIDRLLELQSRQRGFFAGAAFAISAFGYIVTNFFHKISQ